LRAVFEEFVGAYRRPRFNRVRPAVRHPVATNCSRLWRVTSSAAGG